MRGYSFRCAKQPAPGFAQTQLPTSGDSMSAQHCSVKNGKKGKGAAHAQYVVGLGKYAGREDVLGVLTGNMPDWSPDGVTFFVAADKHERLNGRSYKEIEFAIPREVEDPIAYAKQFAEKLLGKNFVYLAGIHSKIASDGLPNTHCHLMFSERRLDGHARNPEHFFKRANSKNPALGGCGKDREMNKREFVQDVRDLHQAHAQSHGVELDMRSNAARGLGPAEPKIGPADRRGNVDTYRDAMSAHVDKLRKARKPKPQKVQDEPEQRKRSFNQSNTRPKHPARRENRLYDLSECLLDTIGLRGETEPAKLLPSAGSNDMGQPRQEAKRERLPRTAPAAKAVTTGIDPRSRFHPDNVAKREAEDAARAAAKPAPAPARAPAPTPRPLPARTAAPAPAPAPTPSTVQASTLSELLAASLAAMVRWIRERGDYQQIKPNVSQVGPIVNADEFHAVQKISRTAYVIHEQSRFKTQLHISTKVLELHDTVDRSKNQGQGRAD